MSRTYKKEQMSRQYITKKDAGGQTCNESTKESRKFMHGSLRMKEHTIISNALFDENTVTEEELTDG